MVIGTSAQLAILLQEAALNFGECFSYALSVARGEPLLFTGKDFAKTDVEVCRW